MSFKGTWLFPSPKTTVLCKCKYTSSYFYALKPCTVMIYICWQKVERDSLLKLMHDALRDSFCKVFFLKTISRFHFVFVYKYPAHFCYTNNDSHIQVCPECIRNSYVYKRFIYDCTVSFSIQTMHTVSKSLLKSHYKLIVSSLWPNAGCGNGKTWMT